MNHKQIIPTIIVLTFFCIVSAVHCEQMYSGLGVSNMNIVATINGNQTKKHEVGRIYNTGDFNMTIHGVWVPNGDGSGINVTVVPSEMFLMPDEAEFVYVEATGLQLGNYSGKIDFSTNVHLPANYTGNPSEPGGTMNAKFVVVKGEPITVAPPSPLPLVATILGIVGIVAVAVVALARGRRLKF